jgi:hypothetical protein
VSGSLVTRPARYGRLLCGTERNGRWSHFLGVPTVYDPQRSTVAYDFHPHEHGGLAPLDGWVEVVAGELNRRAGLGLEFTGWPIVKRADVGVDVAFRDPEVGRAFYEGLRDRRYTKGRRVQERQAGWFSVLGRGRKQPVMHGRVYDKGVETRRAEPWRWIRTERIVRWERRAAMQLRLLTPGALRYEYDDVFVDGLAAAPMIRGAGTATALVALVEDGRLTERQYEQLAGFVLAERAGLVDRLYGGRPELVSRRRALARDVGLATDGARATVGTEVDLSAIMRASLAALGAAVDLDQRAA